jgi:hypothetical protein
MVIEGHSDLQTIINEMKLFCHKGSCLSSPNNPHALRRTQRMMKADFMNIKRSFMFIKSADTQVAGQGHGMPCPCKDLASQHIDAER